MKYYIIAGEASGDLHGSNLIKELKKLDLSSDMRCWGGDRMAAAGGLLVKHYRDLAFMGFAEVILNLRTIMRNLSYCKKDILEYKPDALILIDYPGFNLRIAKWAKQQGIKVIYYISPQVWAWKEGRVKLMKSCIDKMIVILPFEKDYFKNKWNWEVEYVGHPLVEVIDSRQITVGSSQSAVSSQQSAVGSRQSASDSLVRIDKKIVALLPGSRKQEIIKKLPVMLEVSRLFSDCQFIIAKAPGVEEDFYDDMVKDYSNVSWVADKTYDLLDKAKAALVTSGTATLETALFAVPEAVCYKTSWLSYQIGKRLIKIKYISLVNLIMDRLVVKEFIQHEMRADKLGMELTELLNNPERIEQLKKDYAELKELLSQGGHASAKAARLIYDFLGK